MLSQVKTGLALVAFALLSQGDVRADAKPRAPLDSADAGTAAILPTTAALASRTQVDLPPAVSAPAKTGPQKTDATSKLADAGAVEAPANAEEARSLRKQVDALAKRVLELENRSAVQWADADATRDDVDAATAQAAAATERGEQVAQNRAIRTSLLSDAADNLERAYQGIVSGNEDSVALTSAVVSLGQSVSNANRFSSAQESLLTAEAVNAVRQAQAALAQRNYAEAQSYLMGASAQINQARRLAQSAER